jgi:predicted MFS family arabinose efflux permease
MLAVSALLALAALAMARVRFPLPQRLEHGDTASARGFTSSYWLYMLAGAFFAAGLMSFEFISYHLSATRVVADYWIPVLLAIATAFGVMASLVLGKLYDRRGLPVVAATRSAGCSLIEGSEQSVRRHTESLNAERLPSARVFLFRMESCRDVR